MRETLPETSRATSIKGALNDAATPSGPMVESGQFLLGSADARCREGASRMSVLVHQAQRDNGFTLSTVASLADKDIAAASRAFDPENPHTVLRFVAAIVLLDKSRTFVRGLSRLAGGEFIDRPRLTPEQKLERLTDTLRRHGKVGEALIAEALGEDAP